MSYTKANLAQMVFYNMSSLATDAGYEAASAASNTVGFGYAVDFAVITVIGTNDVTLVTDSNLVSVITWAEYFALKKLYNFYATAVDFKLGPREEKLSQIARAIDAISAQLGLVTSGPIVFRDMLWEFNDFTTASGTANWPINWFERDFDSGW